MPRKSHAKPKTPDQIAAEKLLQRKRSFEVVGLQPEAAALQSSADIETTREGEQRDGDGKKVAINSAMRTDAFTALKQGMGVGAYDAARRLERDILKRRNEADKGRSMERVDTGLFVPPSVLALIDVGRTVDSVLSKIGDRDAWLLHELIAPRKDTEIRCTSWRDVVAYITGETHHHCQGAVVRAACANLKAAYDRHDAEVAEAAKRAREEQRAAA